MHNKSCAEWDDHRELKGPELKKQAALAAYTAATAMLIKGQAKCARKGVRVMHI